MMCGTSLRSVAELLGHQSMKMTMRYAHLSPAFLSAEVRLLDPPTAESTASPELKLRPTTETEGKKSKRARKGQSAPNADQSRSEVPEFVKDFGSSGWTRTSNPPVNSRKTGVLPPVASACADVPDRKLDPINIHPIDNCADAAVSRPRPRLGVSKRQEKGNGESG